MAPPVAPTAHLGPRPDGKLLVLGHLGLELCGPSVAPQKRSQTESAVWNMFFFGLLIGDAVWKAHFFLGLFARHQPLKINFFAQQIFQMSAIAEHAFSHAGGIRSLREISANRLWFDPCVAWLPWQ